MQYLGEIISLGVACSWTVTAIVSEIATKRMGVLNFNAWRLGIAALFTCILVFIMTGSLGPAYAGSQTWFWMGMSGFVGFFLGDFCLFKSYVYISSRYGQIFMTLAPAAAAVAAWLSLGQTLTWGNVLAMIVTMGGIALSLCPSKESGTAFSGAHFVVLGTTPQLGLIGALYGLGASICQGLGLVLSKIGMEYYERDVPADFQGDTDLMIPFSANMIRCIVGFACFMLVVLLGKGGKQFLQKGRDSKAMQSALMAVVFGPFLGVAFSLMALQYTQVGIAQTLMALVPIIIILPSYWIFKQPITIKGVVGACISVAGAAMFFLL